VADLSGDNIHVTPLKRITTEGGDVMHALKNSDTGFNGFGEVYFSWVEFFNACMTSPPSVVIRFRGVT
jgi:hypothetical protein